MRIQLNNFILALKLKCNDKILLIEDDVAFCKLLEKFLIKSFEVTTAFSMQAKSKSKTVNLI
jgi:two-component system response regulator HydG